VAYFKVLSQDKMAGFRTHFRTQSLQNTKQKRSPLDIGVQCYIIYRITISVLKMTVTASMFKKAIADAENIGTCQRARLDESICFN
jgi:hypothetical protein